LLEPAWHVIIGGDDATGHTRKIELFNWKTGEQCNLNDLPFGRCSPLGAVFDGALVICGGYNGTVAYTECNKYNVATDSWETVSKFVNSTVKVLENLSQADMLNYSKAI